MHHIPVELEEKALHAAAAATLATRGYEFSPSLDDGLLEFEITHQAIDDARLAIDTYLGATDYIPTETKNLVDGLYSLAFDGRLGDWKSDPDARLVLNAISALRVAAAREETRRRKPLPIAEVAALVEEKLELLGGLYERTGKDWTLTVSNVLTEPVCPTAVIAPEGSNALRYSVHRNSFVEAIIDAADLVHRELILGEPIAPESPITNPDDRRKASYLKVVEDKA